MNDTPTTYSVYGLAVSSDVKLPELRVNQGGRTTDVTVRCATLESVSGTYRGPDAQRIRASPGRCRVTYDSLGTFLIESGERILYDPVTPDKTEQKIFRRLLENQAMAVLLLQRGLLVLHASAVSVDGKAVVFLGSRTAGKSTMTAALHREGYQMIADDVVGIKIDDGMSAVVPGVPQIRLDGDTIEGVGIEETIRYEHDRGPEKSYQPIDNQSSETELGSMYTLQDNGTARINNLDGSIAFFQLVTSTYAQGLLSDTDATTEHFEQCDAVLNQVSLRQLARPKNFERLPEVAELIAEDTKRHDTGAASTAE